MVSIISARTLDADSRVQFFKRFGRVYFIMAGSALAVALTTGWIFLAQTPWSDNHARIAVGSGALLLTLASGIVQARDLTRRRTRLVQEPRDAELAKSVLFRARLAAGLRVLIGVFSLGIVVQVVLLLSAG